MNKLNVKQFKKRFIRGLVEPDLFKLPLRENKNKKGSLLIQLLTYSSYDLDNEKVIETNTIITYGAIVVKDSRGNVVYNSKYKNNNYRFYIPSLPYGTYKIKVIRSNDDKVDNKWHIVDINNDLVTKDIILPWFAVSKSEIYIKEDEEVPYYLVGNYSSKYVSYNNFSAKGRLYCRVFEGNNIIIDEPLVTGSIKDWHKIMSSTISQHRFLEVYSFPFISSITVSYILTAFDPNAETPNCSISWTKKPCCNKTLDKSKTLDTQGLTNSVGYSNEYEGEPIYTTVNEGKPDGLDVTPVVVSYDCVYSGKQEGNYRNPKNKSGTNYCQSKGEFDYRPNVPIVPVYSNSLLSVSSMFNTSLEEEERVKNGYDNNEYNGDNFYYCNNQVLLIGFTNGTKSNNEPHSEFFSYINCKEEYEKAEENISKGLDPRPSNTPSNSTMDRYEYIRLFQNTHYPYTDFISKSELYPYYTKTHSPIRTKAVTIISISNNKRYYQSNIVVPQNEDGSEYIYYEFNAYTNYSDDYDQY